jgi:hypothetical protein
MYFPLPEWNAQIISQVTETEWRAGKLGVEFTAHVWRNDDSKVTHVGTSQKTLALAVADCIKTRKIVLKEPATTPAVENFSTDAEQIAGGAR